MRSWGKGQWHLDDCSWSGSPGTVAGVRRRVGSAAGGRGPWGEGAAAQCGAGVYKAPQGKPGEVLRRRISMEEHVFGEVLRKRGVRVVCRFARIPFLREKFRIVVKVFFFATPTLGPLGELLKLIVCFHSDVCICSPLAHRWPLH